jgi:hypothetical protein
MALEQSSKNPSSHVTITPMVLGRHSQVHPTSPMMVEDPETFEDDDEDMSGSVGDEENDNISKEIVISRLI